VLVLPFWHFLQAATHWSITFGLYDGKLSVTQSLTEPVVSSSGRQAPSISNTATNSAHRNMEHSSPWLALARILRFAPRSFCIKLINPALPKTVSFYPSARPDKGVTDLKSSTSQRKVWAMTVSGERCGARRRHVSLAALTFVGSHFP